MELMIDLKSFKELCFHQNNSDLLLLKNGAGGNRSRLERMGGKCVSLYAYIDRAQPHPISRQLPVCHCQLPLQGEQKWFRY